MRKLTYPQTIPARPSPKVQQVQRPAAATKTIPFDYVFQFNLTGKSGNKVQDIVEISTEGVFVALSIGYSLVPNERLATRTFAPDLSYRNIPIKPAIFPIVTNTPFEGFVAAGSPEAEIAVIESIVPLDTQGAGGLFINIINPTKVGPDGITYISKQYSSDVQSVAVLRVWDRTNNLVSDALFLTPADQGGILTATVGPNPQTKKMPEKGDKDIFVYGWPNGKFKLALLRRDHAGSFFAPIQPIDISLTEELTFGYRTGRMEVEDIIATGLITGDVIIIYPADFGPFSLLLTNAYTVPGLSASTIPLKPILAGLDKMGSSLMHGFRLNPQYASLIDIPFDQLASGTLNKIFETSDVSSEETSFLYSLDVVGTGRELQNRPIHNLAGLGIANGDRPFRQFAKPVVFEPRSAVRIQVEERSGPPGTLYMVLQGYKILGTGRMPV